MKYELILTGKFKKGLKLAKKRGLNIALLNSVVEKLLQKISEKPTPLGVGWIAALCMF